MFMRYAACVCAEGLTGATEAIECIGMVWVAQVGEILATAVPTLCCPAGSFA